MKKVYIITSLLWLILAGAVVFESWRLGVGTLVGPGPGFVPFLAAATLGVLALVGLTQTFLEKGDAPSPFRAADIAKILLVNLLLVVGVLLWDWIGFIPVTFLLLIFMFRVLKPIGWGRALAAATVTMVFTWVLFVKFLGLRVPRGSLWTFFLN